MAKRHVNPFAALIAPPPARLPKTTAQQLVVEGKRVQPEKHLKTEDGNQAKLRRERARAYAQARYQRDRQNPEAMAKRRAWYEANKDRVREYKRAYDEAHADEMRAYKADWARRNYHATPEQAERRRQATRDYYARNREKILARLAEKTAARRAAKTQGAS